MATVEAPSPARTSELTSVPWRPVAVAIVAACGLLLATSGRYGYHRDELYFRMLPNAWGYVDQPPLTPLLAKASIAIFGDTPTGLRVPSILMFGVGIVLAVLTTRELGGSRRALTLSAWGAAFSVVGLTNGHLFTTAAIDFVLWAAVLLCTTRALLRSEPRWWLAVGALVGLATYNKLLISMLVTALLVGLAAVGPRSVFRSRHLWVGGAIAAVLALPNLIYQVTHHFPQLTMAHALSENNATDVRIQLLPGQFLLVGLALVGVWIAGFRSLWRNPTLRFIPVAYLVAVVLTFIGGGQVYYAVGVQSFLLAAGWVAADRWWRSRDTWTLLPLNAITGVLVGVPILPVAWTAVPGALNGTLGDQVGWPQYVQSVADVYAALPAADQAHAVILTGNYGEAGAINRYGPQHGLPPTYSDHNELWFEGPPPADRTVVIVWTEGQKELRLLDGCAVKSTMDNGQGVDNEEQGSKVAVCRVPAAGWAAIWPELQHYD
jgi:4-amino-4-deoxy-L-arabinose transferase-like glycosyltransferase